MALHSLAGTPAALNAIGGRVRTTQGFGNLGAQASGGRWATGNAAFDARSGNFRNAGWEDDRWGGAWHRGEEWREHHGFFHGGFFPFFGYPGYYDYGVSPVTESVTNYNVYPAAAAGASLLSQDEGVAGEQPTTSSPRWRPRRPRTKWPPRF